MFDFHHKSFIFYLATNGNSHKYTSLLITGLYFNQFCFSFSFLPAPINCHVVKESLKAGSFYIFCWSDVKEFWPLSFFSGNTSSLQKYDSFVTPSRRSVKVLETRPNFQFLLVKHLVVKTGLFVRVVFGHREPLSIVCGFEF